MIASSVPAENDRDLAAPCVPGLSIIAPTYNEKPNIRPLVVALAAALEGVTWELIVVDDDSPDGTADEVLAVARSDPRVRCLRRVGRRGLSSAVIEGILASSAPVVAVMDADLQHDERILPEMLTRIAHGADLVVGSRYASGGGTDGWDEGRARMSRLATKIGRVLVGHVTSDPMSGFFMARRQVVSSAIYDLSQQGYKILLDLIASSPGTLRIVDVPYVFRERRAGDSKLSSFVMAEFLFLIIDKLSGGRLPPRFVLFAGVGALGLIVHLAVLNFSGMLGSSFVAGQILATVVAMAFNFIVNNRFTFRDRRLTGLSMLKGLALFMLICSVGALANVSVATLAQQEFGSWNLAGVIGALMGAVFNFGVASSFVWNRRRRVASGLNAAPR